MSIVVIAALLLVTIVWWVLPLIPALRELSHPTDDQPLTMVGRDAGDLTVFADGFRGYLQRELPPSILASGPHSEYLDKLRDGTPVVQLNGRPELLDEVADDDRTVRHLVLTSGPVRLPGNEVFTLEVYARSRFVGGPDAAYRALLAEEDAVLGDRSSVLRWVHAERNLTVGARSELAGRASAGNVLRLRPGVTFGRVRAARIVAGDGDPELPAPRSPLVSTTFRLPRDARRNRAHVRIAGDFVVPAKGTVVGTLVVSGNVRLGPAARVGGSIKAHGDIILAEGAAVDGSIVSPGTIDIGAGCRVEGPVIAEREAIIRAGASIGRPDMPSTVTAERILIEAGAQIFGALAARTLGSIADRPGPTPSEPFEAIAE